MPLDISPLPRNGRSYKRVLLLYANLDWLQAHQVEIENKLFGKASAGQSTALFLYDVTRRYLEGEKNPLAAFGYNRDGKKGERPMSNRPPSCLAKALK